jgi:hypothetical protein
MNQVVVLEFNELCPSLLSEFMQAGKLPNFSRLYKQSHIFTSEAKERSPHLDPWIQWITVHSGADFNEHGINLLGDGHKFQKPQVWDRISARGQKVWVCGSMNINYTKPINGLVLPDPWSATPESYPAGYFAKYERLVRNYVQEYTSEKVPLKKSDYLAFLGFMLAHGLSFNTVWAVVRQLMSELGGDHRWKRAVILDKLQFDVFMDVFRREQPVLSTFFLNSTAHMQHCYWRNMQPELFKIKPDAADQAKYESAILFGYQEMDGLVGRFLDQLGEKVSIVFCTALSQQPCLLYEESGGKTGYRPKDFDRFVQFAGYTGPVKAVPVMAEEFHLLFESEQEATAALRKLTALRVDNEPLLRLRQSGKELFAGCGIYRQLDASAVIRREDGESKPFFDLLYQFVGLKSGMHHPDGAFWVRLPAKEHVVHPEKVALNRVAGTITSLVGAEEHDLPAPVEWRAFASARAGD